MKLVFKGYTFISIFIVIFFLSYHAMAQSNSERLETVISNVASYKAYDTSEFPLGRFSESLSQEYMMFAKQQINLLDEINTSELTETELISLQLLKFKLNNTIDAYNFNMHLNPIQADQGFHLNLNYRIKPISNFKGAIDYLQMLKAIPNYVDDHLVLLEKGIQLGISQPKVIFKGYEATYDTHIVDDAEESEFYMPFLSLPNGLSIEQKDSLKSVAQDEILKSVVPSFKKIKVFFEETYLPNTRTKIGVSTTPKGNEFYQNRINFYTTSNDYTPESIHEIGLREVARIKSEMELLIQEVGFKGSFSEFLSFLRTDSQFYVKTGDELLMYARDIAKRIDAQLPKFFNTLPRTPYGVIKVPDAIAPKYTGGRYSGPSSKTQPGYYLVNTYKLESRPLYTLPSLTAHEAVPGHHLQGSLNRELGDSIPNFRKQMYLSAYGEGWALYTEYLGNEMGIYRTPYEEFGKFTYEMWRACRLVVDTGMHAMNWSRDQAVTYMLENTALSEHEVHTETDRYIAWPGQAISYKIGEIKIRELRKKAERELGSLFDIKDFHEVILEQGTVTLPILERRVNAYINAIK